jgi:hypothetical protein
MRSLLRRKAAVASIAVVVLLVAIGTLWRLGVVGATSTSPVVSPAPAASPTVVGTGRQIVAGYGMPIGYGDGNSHVINPTTGEYRSVKGNLHTVSPDLRWAVLSVERIGELPQAFDFWLYDTAVGRNVKHLGKLPFTHVRWSADGKWLSFSRVKLLDKEDSCVDQVRFVEVATGGSQNVALPCAYDRVVPLGWTFDDPGLVLSATVVHPNGEVQTSLGTPALYGPHVVAPDSPSDAQFRQLVGDGGQVFLAPSSALPPAVVDKAVQAHVE